jgi:accessory gene regulator protein AgrB
MKKILLYSMGLIIALFGLLTLFLSTSVIFDWFERRAQEGNYVSYVVWANLISGLLFLFAAYGFFKFKTWTAKLLGIASVILIAAIAGLLVHINAGGLYETHTIKGMIIRIIGTIVFALVAFFAINRPVKKQ